MMGYYGYSHMGGLGLFGGLLGFGMMFVFWILGVLFVVWLVRAATGRGGHMGHRHWQGSHSVEILKERYAKGEINKEEFESKKKDLEG